MMSARPGAIAAAISTAMTCSCSTAPTALDNASQASAIAVATALPPRADNFVLPDALDLQAYELYRMGDAKAVVLVTTEVGSAPVRAQAAAIKALRDRFAGQAVEVLLIDSSLKDTRDSIVEEAKAYGIDIPILMDREQLVAESLGVTRTLEVVLIDPKTWQVAWRGPLNNGGGGGASQPIAEDAVASFLAGRPVPAAPQPLTGTRIAFPERSKDHAKLTYVRNVAPILEAKCVSCHQQGGIGPFAMTDYAIVKGFAPMIRETIRTGRMPPYDADPHLTKLSNNMRLSSAEIKTIVHWVEAGAPRGEGRDPLAAKVSVAPEWPLGKPDLIIDVPAYTIPASGVVDYQRPYIPNPITEGRWIKATTFKVGSRRGVHHVLTGHVPTMPKPGEAGHEGRWGVSVGGYAVGSDSEIMPEDHGAFLPAGGAIGFQNHYTPFGKEEVDRSQLGLYFYKPDEKPAKVMRTSVIINNLIELPPNTERHKETAYLEFPHAALLYSASPHAHYRGAASNLSVRYPDGTEKLLLSLPRYSFNWQRIYTFAEPIKVPAGSKLIARYVYDNSKRNPANPDPNKVVVWGDQSWEEMFFTTVNYRWLDETSSKLVNYDEALKSTAMMGMLDANVNDKIEKAELRGQMGRALLAYWDRLDASRDGVISKGELSTLDPATFREIRRRNQAEASAAPTGGR